MLSGIAGANIIRRQGLALIASEIEKESILGQPRLVHS